MFFNLGILFQGRFPDRDDPYNNYYSWLVQHLKIQNNADGGANNFIVNEIEQHSLAK